MFSKLGTELIGEVMQKSTKNLGHGRFGLTLDFHWIIQLIKANTNKFSIEAIQIAMKNYER